ncbi:hypothetical protein [Jiella mangrovi]|nr:hypothetical protein [Jiella mangrovi]
MISGDGVLIEGVECPRVRLSDGRVFSLVGGDARTMRSSIGRAVRVSGEIVPVSTCMQGLTIRLETLDYLKDGNAG